MPAPALASGARAPLKSFTVRVTRPGGVRIDYSAIAQSSAAALIAALEMHGLARIVVHPDHRREK